MSKAVSSAMHPSNDHVSTLEAARMLGLAVRSVQLMVDRGDLNAWKTPGGHRRITRASVDRWKQGVRPSLPTNTPHANTGNPTGHDTPHRPAEAALSGDNAQRVLLIEDSVHFQTLVSLLVKQHFPDLDLYVASDGIAGLAMTGQHQPDVLLVDILLPGIDGATLITSLRSHPQFQHLQLIVVTSLDGEQLSPYAFALQGLPVIHKPRLASELPVLLRKALKLSRQRQGASP